MKIDLRKDRGILGSQKFLAEVSTGPELSEDDLLVETMRRRHTALTSEADAPKVESPEKPTEESKPTSKSNRNVLRPLLLFILMLATAAYYMYDKGILFSSIDMAKDYVFELVGVDTPEPQIEGDVYYQSIEKQPSNVMPEDLFNQLMPVTDDIAALADSIASISPESLYVDVQDEHPDTVIYLDQEYTPVPEEPIKLSDDDIIIINNRSLLLMITEIIGNYPSESGKAHLFLKRDGLTFSAPRGGEWVAIMKNSLDKFVLGSFNEDYSSGSFKISSKFEIIMNAEQEFQPQEFDAYRLLDILANPFADYLTQIVIDIPRGTDDNPAQISFAGSTPEIQYILSSWAESRSNYLIRSIDIDFDGDALALTIGVIFFNYTP